MEAHAFEADTGEMVEGGLVAVSASAILSQSGVYEDGTSSDVSRSEVASLRYGFLPSSVSSEPTSSSESSESSSTSSYVSSTSSSVSSSTPSEFGADTAIAGRLHESDASSSVSSTSSSSNSIAPRFQPHDTHIETFDEVPRLNIEVQQAMRNGFDLGLGHDIEGYLASMGSAYLASLGSGDEDSIMESTSVSFQAPTRIRSINIKPNKDTGERIGGDTQVFTSVSADGLRVLRVEQVADEDQLKSEISILAKSETLFRVSVRHGKIWRNQHIAQKVLLCACIISDCPPPKKMPLPSNIKNVFQKSTSKRTADTWLPRITSWVTNDAEDMVVFWWKSLTAKVGAVCGLCRRNGRVLVLPCQDLSLVHCCGVVGKMTDILAERPDSVFEGAVTTHPFLGEFPFGNEIDMPHIPEHFVSEVRRTGSASVDSLRELCDAWFMEDGISVKGAKYHTQFINLQAGRRPYTVYYVIRFLVMNHEPSLVLSQLVKDPLNPQSRIVSDSQAALPLLRSTPDIDPQENPLLYFGSLRRAYCEARWTLLKLFELNLREQNLAQESAPRPRNSSFQDREAHL